MSLNTDTLHLKLGRVATGDMTAGSHAVTGLGFSALPWEGSGPPLMPSDVGTEVSMIGAGPSAPFVPAFGPLGSMLVSTLATYASGTAGTLAAAASNNTQPGAANFVLYREIDFKSGSLKIDKSLTSIARSTLTVTIESRNGSMVAIEGMPILLVDDNLGVMWGGAIDAVTIINETAYPGDVLHFELECVSWAYMLDRRRINPYILNGGVFNAMSLNDVAQHLVWDYCDSEGLSVSSVTGPTISLNVSGLGDKSISQALDNAMLLSNDATHVHVWDVSPWRVVIIKEALATVAPWHVSDLDTTETNVLVKIQYKRNRSKLVNNSFLKATNTLGDPLTETYYGDGSRRDFSTALPMGLVPLIVIGGATKTVGLNGGGITFDWYWSPGSGSITQDVGGTVVGSGVSVVITYNPTSTQLFSEMNAASISRQLAIESGTGKWDGQVTYTNPLPQADGSATAQIAADQYADIPKELTLNTLKAGLDVGETLTVTLAQFSMSGIAYTIDQISFTTDGNKMRWSVHCVNGPLLGNYINAFANLSSSGGGGSSSLGVSMGGGSVPSTVINVLNLGVITADVIITPPDPSVGGILAVYGVMDGTGHIVDWNPSGLFQWPPDIDNTPNLGFFYLFVPLSGKWVGVQIQGRKP